ncbi:Zinc finger BED domain-containing [Pleurotus pulmonarius]
MRGLNSDRPACLSTVSHRDSIDRTVTGLVNQVLSAAAKKGPNEETTKKSKSKAGRPRGQTTQNTGVISLKRGSKEGGSKKGSVGDEQPSRNVQPASSKRKGQPQESTKAAPAKRQRQASPLSVASSDERSDVDDQVPIRQGRQSKKGKWAFSNYTPLTATNKMKPIWKWECKHCNAFRSSPRTSGCTDFTNETKPPPLSSNFISHLEIKCPKLPSDATYEAWCTKVNVDGNCDGGDRSTLAKAASRDVMAGFVQRGIEQPAKTLTKKGFRERFVQSVIQEDLPYSFGEKSGIKELFKYILPADFTLPSEYMVWADLDRLHEALSKELNVKILANESKLAIASDLWTSKGSLHAFAGVVAFWIDKDWAMKEYVLELLPLDGDHLGRRTGKEIFAALNRRKIAAKLIANTADNTSSNGVVNQTISKQLSRKLEVTLNVAQMQIGCAAHVVNLACQDILHGVGSAPSTADTDLYEASRGFPLIYDPSEDHDVVEEERRATQESIIDDSDEENDWEMVEGDNASGVSVGGRTSVKKRTPIHKLHDIVIFILRSEVRRSRMRRLICQLCDDDCKHLTLIKSMPIRWNTSYAEMKRGLLLRPAINHFVDQLDRNLTGKKKQTATKMKQSFYLSPSDWDMLQQTANILSEFNEATIELSKSSEPTICKVLPVYKSIETHLKTHINKLKETEDTYNIRGGLEAGLAKLNKHSQKAVESDYILLGAALHPLIRIRWLKNNWGHIEAERAKELLKGLFEDYTTVTPASEAAPSRASSTSSSTASFFDCAITEGSDAEDIVNLLNELELYYSGAYPCSRNMNVLKWWKTYEHVFPTLARIVRDILTIPRVSVSVERLFSSSKHTISDTRSSLQAASASKTIVAKDWLKRGLGQDITYLDNISVWNK